jgi:hypothetical protein
LAVIFYDQSSQTTRIRFNDGFEEHILNEYCIYFTKNKADKAVFERSMLEQCGSNNYFVPLGKKEEPFGAILLKLLMSHSYPIGHSFIELAATALGTF